MKIDNIRIIHSEHGARLVTEFNGVTVGIDLLLPSSSEALIAGLRVLANELARRANESERSDKYRPGPIDIKPVTT